jgi:N-acyl-D-aspartate/D-glutamate deacylase
MQEVIANAVATGAPLHIVHMNSSSLWDYQTNLDLILGAQERGTDITTEAYPYTAASTALQSAIFDEGWQERLQITYSDLQWQDTGERLTEETFNEYREEGGVVIIHMMKPEWIRAQMAEPRVMVASDGMPYAPGAHPRSAGTFARFLGRYVREREVLPLMDGLRKITLMPAQRLEGVAPQMKRKGRIQIGSDADVTVFDPVRIIDTADFDGELTYSEGVEFVLVNGEFVVRDGALVEGARPGQAVLGRQVVF